MAGRFEATRKVAILGILINIVLLCLKLFFGYVSRSQGLIADGFNSAGDVFASFITYIGNSIASKPRDKDHPYGHGKAEYIFSMIISFSLLLVAYRILYNSVESVRLQQKFIFSWWIVAVGLITIVLKSALFLYSRMIGKRDKNLLVLANSEDHRNDIFVTSAMLIGIAAGQMGVLWLDGVVGVGISLWIAFTGLKIFISAYDILMDRTVDMSLMVDFCDIAQAVKGVDHVDEITAKPIGVGFILIVKISVQGDLTVLQGHSIAAQVKEALLKNKSVSDVLVHVNPV